MSQVSNMPIKRTLSDVVGENNSTSNRQIVVAEFTNNNQVINKVLFPRETHYLKEHSSTYEDVAQVLIVKEVIRDNTARLKPGNEILVYRQPNYDINSARRYHETGRLDSPVLLSYTQHYPIEGNIVILFILERVINENKVWAEYAREGAGAKKEILKFIDVSTD